MSRIGKLPIAIPNGVTVEKREKNVVFVKGPKGELSFPVHENIQIEMKEGNLICTRKSDEKMDRSLHGLSRTLIANMIQGVTKGYEKKLEIQGVGYRAQLQGKKMVLSLGYSHPIEFTAPAGINLAIDAEKKNIIIVTGTDKQLVGEVAAKIRSYRKPEPYKGKGIRYEGEYIARKAGKAAAKEK
ncbi:MAG TPA: 50S ribosomal protein L6 [Candidatus Gracilibacteria bacterium]|nr:50S ribosomal protein L6 [Candidatus Gracilibacteria bacterium]